MTGDIHGKLKEILAHVGSSRISLFAGKDGSKRTLNKVTARQMPLIWMFIQILRYDSPEFEQS